MRIDISSTVIARLVLAIHHRYIVKFSDINQICRKLRNEGLVDFIGWEKGRSVPQPNYFVQKQELS